MGAAGASDGAAGTAMLGAAKFGVVSEGFIGIGVGIAGTIGAAGISTGLNCACADEVTTTAASRNTTRIYESIGPPNSQTKRG